MSPDLPLDGKVALVTGGGTGIGAAISRRLSQLGAAVAVHQRTLAESTPMVDAIRHAGGTAIPVGADLRTLDGCAEAVQGCATALGAIDVLINNAAVTGPPALTPLMDFNDDRLLEIVQVNLVAVIRCSQLAAREMQSGGVIVNVGSVAGYAAQPDCAVYSATKSGLIGLTRGLALDLAGRGVRAVYVAPGDIATEASSDDAYVDERGGHPFVRLTPLKRRGLPEEVAKVVGFLCTPDAAFITGTSVVIDGGLLAY